MMHGIDEREANRKKKIKIESSTSIKRKAKIKKKGHRHIKKIVAAALSRVRQSGWGMTMTDG